LPTGWRIQRLPSWHPGGDDVDVQLAVQAPSGAGTAIAVQVKSRVEPRDIPRIVEQLRGYNPDIPHMVTAPFLSPRTRELLRRRGVGYADMTGNIWLAVDTPAIFISDRGADSNPWREGGQSLRSLKGSTAGRVVRALCDYRPPYGVRHLADRSCTPVASVSRVVTLLDREVLVTRDSHGGVAGVDWPALIHRWTQDYSLTGSNRIYRFVEPRGGAVLLDKLVTTKHRYAITGTLAAEEKAPFAPARLSVFYAENGLETARELDLRAADAGANVLVAEPFDEVVFERTWEANDRVYAALSQVAADLLTSPGRGPVEGVELLRWMRENEDAWRS